MNNFEPRKKEKLKDVVLEAVCIASEPYAYKGVVSAEEILAKIEKGDEVDYADVIIKGNIDVKKSIVTSKISIKNCRIDGFVVFTSDVIKKDIIFSRTRFYGRDERHFSHFFISGFAPSSSGCYPIGAGPVSICFRGTKHEDTIDVEDICGILEDLCENGEAELCGFEQVTKEYNPTEIRPSSVCIKGTKFEGTANFTDAVFSSDADFRNVTFKVARFDKTTFKGNARFSGSKFENTAAVSFWGSQFESEACFSDVKFNPVVFFFGAMFNGIATFDRTQFSNDAFFSGVKFEGIANFNKAQFKMADFRGVEFNNARFWNASFNGDACFIETRFRGITTFSRSQFEGNARFKLATFEGYTSFNKAKFSKVASFSAAKFPETVTFVRAEFNKVLILNFSRINWMNLSNVILGQDFRIFLKYSDFTGLRIRWGLIQNRLKYDGATYLALIKNYNNLEWFGDADSCYYQYRIKKAPELRGIKRLLDVISFFFYGYGIYPEYPLVVMITIFIFFSLAYLLNGQADTIENAFKLSIVTLTTTIPINNPTEDFKWLSIVEKVSGWILMSSFLVVLAKKTLR